MLLGTIFGRSCNLALQIHIRLKSCVPLFPCPIICPFLPRHQGELAHRAIKTAYTWTNKNNALRQITKHEVRRGHFRRSEIGSGVKAGDDDPLTSCKPELHHSISETSRYPLDILSFLWEHERDLAVKVFFFHLPLSAANCTGVIVFYPQAEGPSALPSTQPRL